MAISEPKKRYNKKEITIKIVSEKKGGSSGASSGKEIKSDEDISNKILNVLSHPLESAKNSILSSKETGKFLIAQYVFDNAISNVKRISNFSYNKYLNLSENYLLENDVDAIRNSLNTVTGLGTSIIAGAKMGSFGGLGGMIAGAIVGTAAYATGQNISYQQKKYGYYNSIASSTYQSQYSQIRAGLVDGGRNTNE